MNYVKILFFGELPPFSVNGVSLSNKINLEILGEEYKIIRLRENRSDADLRLNYFRKTYSTLVDILNFTFCCLCNRPKILYISLPTSLLGIIKIFIIFSIFRLLAHGKIIAHIHRGDFLSFVDGGSPTSRITCAALKFFSPKLIVLSDSQKRGVQELGFKFVESLPNTVDFLEIDSPEKIPKRAVFITNYIADKGLLYLLDALKILQDLNFRVELNCHGAGDYGVYHEYVRNIGLNNISFFGPIHGVDKFQTLSAAEILILPSLNEGQPLVIIEAMAMGTIVVATKVGVVDEMFDPGYPYLVMPADSLGLANAIRAALEFQDKNIISENLRLIFHNKFSFNAHKNYLLKIFDGFTLC